MVDVVVTVHPGSDLNTVEKRLLAVGFKVHQKLDAINSIIGTTSDLDLSRIRSVEGVRDASVNAPVHIASRE
jgi:hypothetical protein